MSADTKAEPPSKLFVFAIHAALGLPLNMAAVPLSFFGALELREALGHEPMIFDEKGFLAVFAVVAAAVMFSALVQGAVIARGARGVRGVVWSALLVYALGLIATFMACDWLLDSPQLALLRAAEDSINEHGFFLVRQLSSTLPPGKLMRMLMVIVLSPVYLVLGLFDILMMPFVPFTDPDFYAALLRLVPYFGLLMLGSAAPTWLVARRKARAAISEAA